MAWVFILSGSAIVKAGVNANATMSVAVLDGWSNEALAVICDTARADVITFSGSLTANGLSILANIEGCMVAQQIINYDPEAIGRSTAAHMQNVLENQIRRGLNIIKEDKNKTYMGIT